MKQFNALFRREWRLNRNAFALSAGMLVIWIIFSAYLAVRPDGYPAEAVGFAVGPLFLGAVFWSLSAGMAAIDDEWKRGTAQQLLMLPVRATTVVASKLAQFVVTTTLLVTIIVAGAYVVYLLAGKPPLELEPLALPVGTVFVLLFAVLVYLLTLTAAVAARCVPRKWGRVIGVALFVGGAYVMVQLGTWLMAATMPPLAFVEAIDLCIVTIRTQSLVSSTCAVPSPLHPLVIPLVLLYAVGWFVLSSYLLERRAEV